MRLEIFTRRNFVADFIRLKLNFIPKNWEIGFWATLWGLRGNVCTPSIARWKARGRFPIRHNCFFRYLLRLRRYKRKSVEVGVFRRGWVTFRLNFSGRVTFPSNIYGPLDRGIAHYNFAAGSLHTKKLWRHYSIEVDFCSRKTIKSLFEAPLKGLSGNVRTTHSISSSKESLWLTFYSSYWTFSLSFAVETLYAEICRLRRFLKGGSLLVNISGRKRQFPATPGRAERLEIFQRVDLSLFHRVLRYWQTIISFCNNTHIWRTDGQRDRIATVIPCVALHAVAR